ncbi:BTB/POZ domain-containing protein [Aspergillus aculeatinus CBS 121060]|uniref:Uncharacterized protein n=1 Tax=Aspergillus aculeatinus CBS 121060 TaxID=1448322 RepID=A0ACD1H912_9EURO|nr:hypothetical protein BO66DRAFT_438681 [Aspergillus aculeatinus CBS 121060]RAH69974.1 hypothetical protein BO66DRAFT_438681 [Aspergillus aculeatinus CBS 121060]
MASKSVRVSKDSVNKFQGRTIEIVVGDEQRVYGVHEGLVRSSSPFFDKALAGKWKESAQRTVQLPNDEPKIVALYIHWLYYGTLPVFCDELVEIGNSEYLDLAKAYILGDKILDTLFQDTVIDAIIEKSRSTAQDGHRWYPDGAVLDYAYHNIAESAQILELFVDMYVTKGNSSWLQEWTDPTHIPQPFLLSVASKLLDRRAVSKEPLEALIYHIHGRNHDK